jgi:ferredoxin
MKVTVNEDRCVASGQCVLIAPEVFDQDDDGVVMVIDDAPGDAQHPSVKEAVGICPTSAIAFTI